VSSNNLNNGPKKILENCFYCKLPEHQIKNWQKKIANEKSRNEAQNLISNKTRIPHVSKKVRLFVAFLSTFDLNNNKN